jgi:hypothetical protein
MLTILMMLCCESYGKGSTNFSNMLVGVYFVWPTDDGRCDLTMAVIDGALGA